MLTGDEVVAWRSAERHDRAMEIRALDGLWLPDDQVGPVCPVCDLPFANDRGVAIHIGKTHSKEASSE